MAVHEVRDAVSLRRPTVVGAKRRMQTGVHWVGSAWRYLRRVLYPGAPSNLSLVVVGAVIVAVPFVLTYGFGWGYWHWIDGKCPNHELDCGLGIHLLGTALVAGLIFYVFFLRREVAAANRWRSRIRKDPAHFFDWLPQLESLPSSPRHPTGGIVSRDELAREIAEDLDQGAEPQVIVGGTGSGKSMVLVKLAEVLAKRRQIAVPISLRDVKELHFDELARESYIRGSSARHAEDLEKQWHWFRSRGLVTVLADELEKSLTKPADRVAALRHARQQSLRLVVACRPEAIPVGFKRGRIDLERLDEDEVVGHLTDRLAKAQPSVKDPSQRVPREELRKTMVILVKRADIRAKPYYLALAGALADAGAVPDPNVGDDARYELVTAYRTALVDRRIRPEAGLSPETREGVLVGLELVAYLRLLGKRKEQRIEQSAAQLRAAGGRDLDVRSIIDGAQRLGLLTNYYDGEVHFVHPTTRAYYAARYLAERPGDHSRIESVFQKPKAWRSPSVTALTLDLANAHVRDEALARATCEHLLRRLDQGRANGAASLNGSGHASRNGGVQVVDPLPRFERLLLIATAAEIARARTSSGWSGVRDILDRAREELAQSGEDPTAGQRLVRAIGALDTHQARLELWRLAVAHKDYAIQREAIKTLAAGGPAAIEDATTLVKRAADRKLARLSEHRDASGDDRLEPFRTLKAVAWVLPSLRSAAPRGALKRELRELEKRLLDAAQQDGMQRGLEASIAQGLKLDAISRPEQPVDRLAMKMLGSDHRRARFWFSRVLVAQAVARRCVGRDANPKARELLRAMRHDPHPFVSTVADLCDRAIDARGERWRRYIWEDMTEIASGTPRGLSPRATQVMGDIILALNLNEQGHDVHRRAFGDAADLPGCMSLSPDRRSIVGTTGAVAGCPFLGSPPTNGAGPAERKCYCPYAYEYLPEAHARRELSRAFCRHQRLKAQPLSWQPEIKTSALKQFWSDMEERARF